MSARRQMRGVGIQQPSSRTRSEPVLARRGLVVDPLSMQHPRHALQSLHPRARDHSPSTQPRSDWLVDKHELTHLHYLDWSLRTRRSLLLTIDFSLPLARHCASPHFSLAIFSSGTQKNKSSKRSACLKKIAGLEISVHLFSTVTPWIAEVYSSTKHTAW